MTHTGSIFGYSVLYIDEEGGAEIGSLQNHVFLSNVLNLNTWVEVFRLRLEVKKQVTHASDFNCTM